MVRLPNPGGDNGTWGNILNDFLAVEHNSDGSLKTSGTLASKADTTYVDTAIANSTILDWVNVKNYGAKGDGTTDDTAAIAAALATHRVVYFPAGIYNISAELSLSNVRGIIGDSCENDDAQKVSVIRQTNTSAHGLHGQNIANFYMRNIRIDGPGSGTGVGLYLNGSAVSWYIHLEDVRFQNWGLDGVNAFTVVTTFENVLSMNNGRHGFSFEGLAGGAGATSVALIGCFARNNAAAGYHMYNMTYCSFNACAADLNGTGYFLDTVAGISLNGCGVESPQNKSVSYPGTGYKVVAGTGVTMNACFIAASIGIGWTVSSSDNVVLVNPTEILPTGSATSSITVSSNSRAEIIGPAVVTAMSLASGSTTVVGAADKSTTIAGNLTVNGVGGQAWVGKSADQSVTSSTTLVNDTNLTLPIAANATYILEVQGVFTAASGGDIKIGWATLPAGASLIWTVPAVAAGTGSVFSATSVDSWTGSNATVKSFWYRGQLTTAGTAGNVQLQFAQVTNNATPTVLKVGSWIKLERVA